MNWRKLPNWVKGLIIGVGVNLIGTFIFPILIFFGFFGSWLNFSQYSPIGFAANVMENYILSWIIVLTISALIGLYFDLKKKKNKMSINFVVILVILLITEIFAFGYSWNTSGMYQTWETPEDCPKLKDVDAKDSCYYTLAFKNNNPDLCYELSDDYSNWLDVGIQYCLAKVNKDPSYCNNYSSEEDMNRCFSGLAISLLDKSFCDNIKNLQEKNDCVNDYLYYVSINEFG